MQIAAIRCPSCVAAVAPPPGREVFFCDYCGTAIAVVPAPGSGSTPEAESASPGDAFVEDWTVEDAADTAAPPPPEQPVPFIAKPLDLSAVNISRDGLLRISYAWSPARGLGLGALAAILLVVSYFGRETIFAGRTVAGDVIGGLVFLSLGVIAAVAAYTAVACVANWTDITIEDRILRVRHYPIPWPTPAALHADAVDQLFVHRPPVTDSGGRKYDLVVTRRRGRPIVLLRGEQEKNVLRAIELLVEQELGIDDRAMQGEAR